MSNESSVVEEVCLEPAPDPTDYGMFVLVVIASGIILQQILRSFRRLDVVPYTLTVFLFGMLLGGIDIATSNGMAGLSYSMDKWISMDPSVLFHLFVPTLLFSSCFVVDFYVFKRLLFQSVLLATYGVVYSAFLTAVVSIYIFPYDFSWIEGWCFGGMLAATDPVATVALLKDLGAPETLGVLIEGRTKSISAESIIWEIFYSSVVGPCIGLVVAIVSIILMNLIWKDFALEVPVTLCAAYGAFFLGNQVEASGVLAVVTVGVILGGYSSSYVENATHESIKQFWQVADFVANTMLFGYAGWVVIDKLSKTASVNGTDVGMVVVLYVFLNLIRASSILLVWPILTYTGYGMNWRKASIIGWAGLRGAIGLIAALILVAECKCEDLPHDPNAGNSTSVQCLKTITADRMMFQMAGIVLLTLVINGPSTKNLLNFVKLSKQTKAAQIMYRKAAYRLQKEMEASAKALKKEPLYRGADWAQVWAALPVLSQKYKEETEFERRNNPLINPEQDAKIKSNLEAAESEMFEQSAEMTFEILVAQARHHFLSAVKAAYVTQFRKGASSSWPTMKVLAEAASRALDHDGTPMKEWDLSLKHQCLIPKYYRSWWFQKLPFHNWLITNRVARGYDMGTAFVLAHSSAEEDLRKVAPSDIADFVITESRLQVAAAQKYLDEVEESFPHVALAFQTNLAIQRILKNSIELARDMLEHAELGERDHAAIEKSLNISIHQTQARNKLRSINSEDAMSASAYLFNHRSVVVEDIPRTSSVDHEGQ